MRSGEASLTEVNVVYHNWPYRNLGIYWSPSKTIYLYEGLKKYPKLHGAILDHEVEHHLNQSSDRHILRKLLTDVYREWRDCWKTAFDKELRNEVKQFSAGFEELLSIDLKQLMNHLDEKPSSFGTMMYTKTLSLLRPDSNFIKFLIIVGLIIEALILF